MFASDVSEYTARQTLSAADELTVLRDRIDAQLLRLGQHFADLHPTSATVSDHELVPGGEQTRVYGGDGCPAVAEFAVAEFGAVTGRSTHSAARYIGQALALRHRLPRLWAQVESGHATPWKACNVAQACRELSEEAAGIVDRRVAAIVNTLTPLRLHNVVKAAVWEADPIAARAQAEQRARERGVWTGRTDGLGTTTLFVKAATGDIIRFQATLDQLAGALAALGDTSPLNTRRARAIGLIADPALTTDLLKVAHHLTTPLNPASEPAAPEPTSAPAAQPTTETAAHMSTEPATPADSGDRAPQEPRPGSQPVQWPWDQPPGADEPEPDQRPKPTRADEPSQLETSDEDTSRLEPEELRQLIAKLAATQQSGHKPARRQGGGTMLYVHLTDETLRTGEGIARIEGHGPMLITRLEELTGHNHITVRPVIDLNDKLSVDAYEVPQRIREHIKLKYPAEQFVYGTADTSRTPDLDHIQPFKPNGPPGQTNTDNLIPLRRFSHRAKTHGGWQVRRLNDHTVEWTTRNGFKFTVDHHGTHPADRQ